MGGLSELSGGIAQGQGSSVGNAGPATSGGTGGNVFNIASGGGANFNPFAAQTNSTPFTPLLIGGAALIIGALVLMKKKK